MNQKARLAVLSVVLAGAAAYVHVNPPERMVLELGTLSACPRQIESWQSVDLRFEEVVYEELAADDTLVRKYTNSDGESIFLVVIYHQNERYGAHDPLICYVSQGWNVLDEGLVRLRRGGGDFDANWVLIEREGLTHLAVYWWYTAGNLATGDRDAFMSRMAVSGIRSNVTFGAFIRISTALGADGVEDAMRSVTTFSESFLPLLPELFADAG